MKLLTDSELIQRVTPGTSCIIHNVPVPRGGNWEDVHSAVQPSSIDLHVGKIFLPEAKDGKSGSQTRHLEEHILKAGHTVVVETEESFVLPSDIAGIGFPPDTVSSQGILMTNPGHIDPGFKGTLHFTLINMGREPYSLRKGDAIVTVLLFELHKPVKADYAARHPNQSGKASRVQNTLNRLSADFVDVESRAAKIAALEVGKAGLWAAAAPTVISGVIALITALVVSSFAPWKDPIQEVRKDVAVLQSKADPNELKTELNILQNKADPNELKNQIRQLQDQLIEIRTHFPITTVSTNQAPSPGKTL